MIEWFHRTLVEGWAFEKFYNSESARLAALPAWVHLLQRPPAPVGHREAIIHHQIGQPSWTAHLVNLPEKYLLQWAGVCRGQ